MFDREKALIDEMIYHVELLRNLIYEEKVNLLSYEPEKTGINPHHKLPKCDLMISQDNGYPVYRFTYPGLLPTYKEEKKYSSLIRDYYISATIQAMENIEIPQKIKKALLLFVYSFSNRKIRDFDNRNQKWVIDGIRRAKIIEDDSWENIEIMETGMLNKERGDMVTVFVLPTENFIHFLTEFRKNPCQNVNEKLQNMEK